MKENLEYKAGIALIIFTFLLLLTMILHPAGGSMEHLIRISGLIIITHSIAILSLPIGWIGFRGLTRRIGQDDFWSALAFAFISFGMFAVMIAAATNGLVLPVYLQHYKDAAPEMLTSVNPVLRYGFAVNKAFDYIYSGAFCLAIMCWSVAIFKTKKMEEWIGWFGLILSVLVAVILISGIAFNGLSGFRVFTGTVLIWILLAGIELIKIQPSQLSQNEKREGGFVSGI